MSDPLADEDAKLLTLARGARGRIEAATGAAVRDDMGRSYAAADVHLPSLQIGALHLAVAQAVAAGATGLEAAVVVQADEESVTGVDAVRDLGGDAVAVFLCAPDGRVRRATDAGSITAQ